MPQKILIVDDEEDVISMLSLRFEASGYEIISAFDGEEGINKARKEKPDLIVSDVLMPKMDGFAFYKELKKDPATAAIPVLILTARGKMEDTFRVMGADDFVAKPFDAQKLLEKVQSKLGKGAVAAQGAAPKTAAAASKRAFITGTNIKILETVAGILEGKKCEPSICLEEGKIVEQITAGKPDVIVMEVLVANRSAHELISRIRSLPEMKAVPILLYSSVDKDNLGGMTVAQKIMEIDKAKKACLEAGATETSGGFEQTGFERFLSKHL